MRRRRLLVAPGAHLERERERDVLCRFLLGVQGSGLGDVGLGVSVFLGLGFRG